MTASRVLVALDDCGPGDALLINFCLVALRRALPSARIDCLASRRAAPVLELAGLFDRVIVSGMYDQRSASRAGLLWPKLAAACRLFTAVAGRYDLAVTFYWGSSLLNLLAWLAAPFRSVGYANRVRWLVSGGLGRYRPAGDPVAQAVGLMRAVGIEVEPAVAGPLVPIGHRSQPAGHGEAIAGRRFAVVHMGSDWACQQWLPGRWAAVADRLAVEHGLLPVFSGVAEEEPAIDSIRTAMREASISLAGHTTVEELARLLEEADLYVGVDSLAFEMAQSAGVPAVVLAGQSRVAISMPTPRPVDVVNRTSEGERAAILDCKLTIVKASYGGCQNFECPMAGLRGISVEDVLGAVSRLRTPAAAARASS